MKDRRNILQQLTDAADLGGEPLPGQSLVEIAGDQRVLIEHHFGVKEYSTERICVHVKYGYVIICGCSLELIRMTKEQLIIAGRIDTVSLCRRGK